MSDVDEDDFKVLVPLLTQTIEYSLQGVRQSIALSKVLIAKGLVNKAELDEAMRSTDSMSSKLLGLLDAVERHAKKPKTKPS